MLTEEQKYENQMKYIELLGRLGVDLTELTAYLNTVQYFDAPASNQYNGAYAGGLCEYALKFCFELGQLCNAYFPGRYTEQDIICVALLKDLYRAEMYEAYSKNVKNETTGQWDTVGAYRTRENRPCFGNIGLSSYMIAKRYLSLTDEQIEAIMNGNALDGYSIDIHDILKQYPLTGLAKMADIAVNYFQ